MKHIGLCGRAPPEECGGPAGGRRGPAGVTEELARGWMSLAGAMGGHTVVAKLLAEFGTEEQQRRTCRGWPPARLRATMALTEPGGGSDLQAMRTVARRDGDELRRQRVQDVDHQRPPVAADRPAVQDRPRQAAPPGHLDPAGRARPGPDGLAGPAQARLQGRRELRAGLRRLPGAGVGAARRRGAGLRADDDGPRDRPHPGGGAGARGRPGRVRGRAALRPGAGERSASRSGSTSRSATTWPTWPPSSPPPASSILYAAERFDAAAGRPGGRDGQAVRLRDRDGGRAGRGPHPRRLRLLDRVRRRALLPRRPADDRRRGHQRDPPGNSSLGAGSCRRGWRRASAPHRYRIVGTAPTGAYRGRRYPLLSAA